MSDAQDPEKAEKPRRGRPPKVKICARCAQSKKRSEYNSATDDTCTSCKREISAGNPFGPRSPAGPGFQAALVESVQLAAVTEAISTLFATPPRCECCYEHRHVARDTYGGVALVCKRCEYQIRATGACHLHNSRLFYPELATSVTAVPSPPEIEALFAEPVPARPQYDPAELAEVDI